MSNYISKQVGKYISYKLKLKGITHNDIAKSANLSTAIITCTKRTQEFAKS